MNQKPSKTRGGMKKWLLFFYSIPSRPVSNRMKIWRRLAKVGAVPLKGSVYILPFNEEHHELFQWLVSEVSSMGGEAAFTGVEKIDSLSDQEIIDIFIRHADEGYLPLKKNVEDLETKINSIRKGSRHQGLTSIAEQLNRLSRSVEDARKTDFFSSGAGEDLQSKIISFNRALKGMRGPSRAAESPAISHKNFKDFQDKIWVTRTKPFVDRMASAWLIRKFIDRKARFSLRSEKDIPSAKGNTVTFDISGGTFTHAGDLCTFEVLIRSFGLKDKTVKKIAEIVHELDIKDDKFTNPEAKGLAEILSGIRKAEQDDLASLEKGMAVFEMLYVSKSG